MSSKGRMKCCRVCGGGLQGNQRRWLYGVQDRRGGGHPQTPTESLSRGSVSKSSQSSPWGSTTSLASSVSISKFHTSLTPTKGIDLLSILTHILGQSVPRGNGQEEFLCGKCVSVLERVFKFDTVIARVRVLSSERLQKLYQERDKIRQWVRSAYRQHHPPGFRTESNTSEEDGEEEKEGYRDMLTENMVLSEFECWSEKWERCKYFRRTGKKCKEGKDCEGCDSLRVSDSDYESVCGIPRYLPFQAFSPLASSRVKSQSMPLHWSRRPSLSSSAASLIGSSLSLQAPSSSQSVDSLDGNDCLDWRGDQSFNLVRVLKDLKSIERKPMTSPSGSRIPVLERKEERNTGEAEEVSSPILTRALNFGEGEEEENVDELNGERSDLLTDEFIPLHTEHITGRMHLAVSQLRRQLVQAMARINTLEMELKRGQKPTANSDDNKSVDSGTVSSTEGGDLPLHSIRHTLHSREQVMHKFLESLQSEMSERDNRLDGEIEELTKIGKDKDMDINILNTVLRCNQDIINGLRVELAEKEQMQKQVQKEREVWRQREQTLSAVIQEKEELLHYQKEVLESCQKDVQALSDSVIGHGMSGGRAEGALASQLQDKEALLTVWIKGRDEQSATLCQEVTKLTTALNDYQNMVQEQQETHSQTVSLLKEQLCETQNKLRERCRENKEVEKAWEKEKQDRERKEWKLRDSLEMRNKLIEQVLLDSEERDHLFQELQQNLLND
ncbi:uncharacterized protein si:ch73-95l15.5 isoform X2 [Osmerus eperlanus]|uniref:uncharacterized protein si:ch73-95l15.5 isoform X2 n=1 Tax=Osmerus eperlanus TaxID=29151 RepID=UPI002E0D4FB4